MLFSMFSFCITGRRAMSFADESTDFQAATTKKI
jgi:hypothetical protein